MTNKLSNSFLSKKLIPISWVFAVSLVSHCLYSPLGFNPTDDGFTLAYSQRIINGEFPHRDFITIRPALSPLLHTPEVLIGGNHTYMLSRFIFFLQISMISWISTSYINKQLGKPFNYAYLCIFGLLSFTLCCHTFPPMAWHTIDGLFLCILGTHLNAYLKPKHKYLSYIFFGSACLCKQSFIFICPIALLILGDWKQARNIFSSFLPLILYIAIIVTSGGANDAWNQMGSQTGFYEVAIKPYIKLRTISGIIFGVILTYYLRRSSLPNSNKESIISIAILCLSITYTIYNQTLNNSLKSSFLLPGIVAGIATYISIKDKTLSSNDLKTGLIIILISWSCSLSIGYNSPVFGSGLLITYTIAITFKLLPCNLEKLKAITSTIIALTSITSFHYIRTNHIYRDMPAIHLSSKLDAVLPGGENILTNEITNAFLNELDSFINEVNESGLDFAIIPSVAGYWVNSAQRNPIPIDWPQGTELNSTVLKERVYNSIIRNRNRQMVIVQKVNAGELSKGIIEINLNDPYYETVKYVKENLTKVSQGKFFELYK
jgi:hypothetical protein